MIQSYVIGINKYVDKIVLSAIIPSLTVIERKNRCIH